MSSDRSAETLVACPFCGEDEFDHIGLKHHLLNGWCEVFELTQPVIAELVGAKHE